MRHLTSWLPWRIHATHSFNTSKMTMNGFRFAVVTVKRSLKLSYKPPTHERVTKYREAFVPNVGFFCEKGRWVGLGRVVEDERGAERIPICPSPIPQGQELIYCYCTARRILHTRHENEREDREMPEKEMFVVILAHSSGSVVSSLRRRRRERTTPTRMT